MRLEAIFIRFYKSFNVDHLRQYLGGDDKPAKSSKSKKEIKKEPWELIKTEDGDLWFPFIKIPIDPQITAVVGANESGKSHLLTVIEVVKELQKKNKYDSKKVPPEDIKALEQFTFNFKILFQELNKRINEAEMERTKEKASEKVKHLEERFFNNHPNGANKEDAVVFLRKLRLLLMGDTRFDAEAIKNKIESIERDYELDQNLTERIENYQEFTKDIKSLKFQGKNKSEEIAEED